jgi:hypothetical protein
VRTRIAASAAVVAASCATILATPVPALAIENPIAATIAPVGSNGATGNVTFFQMGSSINIAVSLDKDTHGTQALDLRKGTCKAYSPSAGWPLGTFNGTSQETKLPNTTLEKLVGNVLLIHQSENVASPPVGCAEIKG